MKTVSMLLPLAALVSFVAGSVSKPWQSGACGQSDFVPEAANRIVGGKEAKPNHFPWQVMINQYERLSCGAILISQDWVMTAAHCVSGQMKNADLHVGAHTLKMNDRQNDQHVQGRKVAKVFSHERYNSWTLENDIALLKVSEPFHLNEAVNPVCLPERTDDFSNEDATVSGWGSLRSGGRLPNALQYVTVPVITENQCKQAYGSSITGGMLCAGRVNEKEFDACQGDSGGPLVVRQGGRFDLVGVVSWGIGCASGYPGVYTRVTTYMDWISNIIDNN